MKKSELLGRLDTQRELFLDILEKIPEDAWLMEGVVGTWSIKDILAHLSRWEAELVKLLWQIQHGLPPSSIHFENQDVDEINSLWQKESHHRSLERVLDDFHSVRTQTILRVEALSDQDFNEPKKKKVLKGQPLWEWIANDSFGHEAEHMQEIIKWKEINGF